MGIPSFAPRGEGNPECGSWDVSPCTLIQESFFKKLAWRLRLVCRMFIRKCLEGEVKEAGLAEGEVKL